LPHHVIVMELVSRALGEKLPRAPLLAVLNRLYNQLAHHYDRWRGRRTPEFSDDCFDYVLYLADDDNQWHTFRFVVNDRIAQGHLFVMAVSHRIGKLAYP
jgi:hypothetical protein